MKSLRVALTMMLMSLSAAALAQHEHASAPAPAAPSEAQKSFEMLKTLAGSWEGTLTPVPAVKDFSGMGHDVSGKATVQSESICSPQLVASQAAN